MFYIKNIQLGQKGKDFGRKAGKLDCSFCCNNSRARAQIQYILILQNKFNRKRNKIKARGKKSELKRYVHLTKMPLDHHIGLATFLHNDRPWFKIFCNVSPQLGTNVYIEWRFSPHRVPLLFSSGIGKLCQNEIWDSSKLCDAVHWLLSDMSPIIVYPCRQLTHWSLVLRFEWCDPGWWRCQVDTWK